MLGGAGTHKLSRCIHWCLPVPPREYGHVLSGGVTMLTMATYMHVRVRLRTTGVKMCVTWLCGLHDGSQSADQYGLPSAYVYTSVSTQAQLKWSATMVAPQAVLYEYHKERIKAPLFLGFTIGIWKQDTSHTSTPDDIIVLLWFTVTSAWFNRETLPDKIPICRNRFIELQLNCYGYQGSPSLPQKKIVQVGCQCVVYTGLNCSYRWKVNSLKFVGLFSRLKSTNLYNNILVDR